jgi:ElaA protein
MVHWNWKSFQELSKQELYDLLALRANVFIVEQQSPYGDLDYRDQHSLHLLGKKDDKLAAYLRILPENVAYPNAVSIGRFVTAAFVRGQGLGKEMMRHALLYLKTNGNKAPIVISAQLYLEKFYQSFGFETRSEPYDEDGILHIKMEKKCDLV